MEKNVVIAIILSAAVLVGSSIIRNKLFPPAPPVEAVPAAELPASQAAPAVQEAPPPVGPASPEAPGTETQERTIVLDTNLAKITFTNRGGDIISYELKEHRDGSRGIEMADNITPGNRAFSLSFGGAGNPVIDGLFSVKQTGRDTIEFSRPFTATSGGTFTLTKRYTFVPNDYMFKLDVIVQGDRPGLSFGGYAYTLRSSPQIGPPVNLKIDRYERRSFMAYTGEKKKRTNVASGKTGEYKDPYTWTGVSGKYFTLLVCPARPDTMMEVRYSALTEIPDNANSQMLLQRSPVTAASDDTYYIYAGPLTEKSLKQYDFAENNPWGLSGLHLDESLNSTGVLSWLETLLKWCMELINRGVHNWGVTIIIVTIILKALTFPLTRKSSMSALKMQKIQPKIQEIQTKYKDNPPKMNEELAKLYKEAGYSPLSGCLPLLIQFPLLIAMFNLFNNYFEFRGSMFIPGWIPDLSVGDSVAQLGFEIPFLGNHIRILPVVYVISQLLSGKLTSSGMAGGSSAAQMNIMMYGMPIVFFFILYNAPSGLVIYWTVSNALQLLQQLVINRIMKQKRDELSAEEDRMSKVFVPKKRKK
ncbi:MAG: membrane protein insertase YidC [Spirochaetaceae bacterium]|jgi:YidC/Oxa1 family membrane protein insertase|nr:membrane protein insertase YidC [Spirochaetaceae bacterium]